MQRKLAAFIVAATLGLALSARAGEENALAKASVGDWVRYKTTMTMKANIPNLPADAPAMTNEGTLFTTITAKDDKQATLKSVAKMTNNGQTMEMPSENTIPLDKAFDPSDEYTKSLPPGITAKEVKSEKQKQTVGGKELDCDYREFELTLAEDGGNGTMKVWTAQALPFRVVKVEMTLKNKAEQGEMLITNSMALDDFGTAKDNPEANNK